VNSEEVWRFSILRIESGYYTDRTVLEHCTELKRLLIASLNTAKTRK